jgi:hypothetical protein
MSVVTFNQGMFLSRYPEFTRVSANLQSCFNEAQIYCNNTNNSPVIDTNYRALLLNMLTAHIAFIYFGASDEPASQLVGRITDAKQGSIEVKSEMSKNISDYEAWFMQTKYGASFWQASAGFRSFFYVGPPQPIPTYVPKG